MNVYGVTFFKGNKLCYKRVVCGDLEQLTGTLTIYNINYWEVIKIELIPITEED